MVGTTVAELLFLVVTAPVFLNRQVLRHCPWGSLRLLVELFRAPADLYTDLGGTEIDIGQKGAGSELVYTNRYRDLHAVVLVFENRRSDLYHKQGRVKLRLNLSFVVDRKEVLTQTYIGRWSPFLRETDFGLVLSTYSCPEVLPLDRPILLRVSVVEADHDLKREAGNTRIVVRRLARM